MRTTLLLLLCATTALAGCAEETPGAEAVPSKSLTPSPPEGPAPVPTPIPSPVPVPSPVEACPSPALSRAAYDAAESFVAALEGKRLTMQMEGTIEGEVDTVTVGLDPQNKRMIIESSVEGTYAFDGEQYSLKTDEIHALGRDFNPKGAFWATYQDFLAGMRSDSSASFAADLTFEDYRAECVTLGGIEAIRYTYESGDEREVVTVERAAPHRPLSGAVVDPALKDNYRIKLAYGEPTIKLDTTATRVPPTFTFEIIDQRTNARGGPYVSARVSEGTHHARLADLDVRLVDEEGTVWREDDLEHADYDFDDGDNFQYRDRDGDNMVSPGDTFVMDVGPGLDIVFYDTWSKQYAVESGTA